MKLEQQQLFQSVQALIEKAQLSIIRNVNFAIDLTHFEIGRTIFQNEQSGNTYATYGPSTIKKLTTI